MTGQPVAVSYSVAVNLPGTGTPTGNVVVTDADSAATCTATVAAASCSLALPDGGYAPPDGGLPGRRQLRLVDERSRRRRHGHPASTTVAITSDLPDPSVVGQSVPVTFTVTAAAPG